jgi:hypothetical protein
LVIPACIHKNFNFTKTQTFKKLTKPLWDQDKIFPCKKGYIVTRGLSS